VRGFRAHPLVQLPSRQTLTLPLSLCPLPKPSLVRQVPDPSLPQGREMGEATHALRRIPHPNDAN
jgi:hypothetical protein